MRPFSARMFANTVQIRRLSYPSGPQAGANPTSLSSPTSHPATVQPMPALLTPVDGGESRRQRARFGFPADPVVSAGDDLVWVDGGALIFSAQGPAVRDGGSSSAYWVDGALDS